MKVIQLLHDLGHSLWLDNITRDLLDNGTLQRYIDELLEVIASKSAVLEKASEAGEVKGTQP